MVHKRKELSKTTKIKISKALKGKHRSFKTEFKKDHKMSKKIRKKISKTLKHNLPKFIFKKGCIPWNKGKTGLQNHSKETRRKMSEAHKGSKASNWKGGITKENELIRGSIEFRLWREEVFARNNYTCQKTGKRGGKLEAHHIKNFADYPELRFVIDNGITFSEEPHDEFHKIYGKRNNNREQLKKYLDGGR